MKFDFHEHIEDFIEGTLDKETEQLMLQALKDKPELNKTIENYPSAKKISEGLLELDVFETLENLESKENKTMTTQKGILNRRIGLGLLLLFAAILIYWLMSGNTDSKPTNDKQFSTEYKAPNDDEATKSNEIETLEDFEQGKKYFQLNEFEQAEKSLGQAILKVVDSEKASEIYFWLGHAQYKQRKFGPARLSWTLSKKEEAKEMIEIMRKEMQDPDPGH